MKHLRVVMAGVAWLTAAYLCAAADVAATASDDALDQRISRLIAQLGDDQFAVRQRAQQELVKMGFDAFDALTEAGTSDDPEIAMQAGYLVRLIRADWTRDTDPRQIQAIFKDYDVQSDERRLARIKQLAELPGDQGLEWLCRLVRFEKSPVLSKQAALAVMGQSVDGEAAWTKRAATITKGLDRGRRPAVKWLLTYVQAQSDPGGALEKWSALAEAERQTLDAHPQETHNQIVMDLLRRKIDLLDRLGRTNETLDVVRQAALCERGDSASLTELIEWLVKRKAWTVLDDVETRFSASFEADAVLSYTLCEARLAQGERGLAEQLADKALKINGSNAQEHVSVAHKLYERGLMDWAEREYRQAIALGPLGSPTDIESRWVLAQRWHDQLRDQEAAELFKELLDAADADMVVMQRLRALPQMGDISPNGLRAWMYVFFAGHAAGEKDLAKQRQLLEKALQQDKTNVDALIGFYQVTTQDPKGRAEVLRLIKDVIEATRAGLEEPSDESGSSPSNLYNQIAWLVANTEGDIDEAIRFSHKSIDLARAAGEGKRVGGLLDTLGHCYFAKKDYANAVKYQTEAAEIDTNTAGIARQLKVFREALARQQQGEKP